MEDEDVIKVYNIDDKVSKIDLTQDDEDKKIHNIKRLFDEIEREKSTISYQLPDESKKDSFIYQWDKNTYTKEDEYQAVAEKLLKAEQKSDGTRNDNIKEGLLFIWYVEKIFIKIMKLEKLEVIDRDTYESKFELGSEKDYFKVFILNSGNYDDIKIIDRNKTAAKYWTKKFLGLERNRTSEDNTRNIIDYLEKRELFSEEITKDPELYKEVVDYTKKYLFNNRDKEFDKSELFKELTNKKYISLQDEDQLFSDKAKENIDPVFLLVKKEVDKKFKKEIVVSDSISIIAEDYESEVESNIIGINSKKKEIYIKILKDKDVKKFQDEFDDIKKRNK